MKFKEIFFIFLFSLFAGQLQAQALTELFVEQERLTGIIEKSLTNTQLKLKSLKIKNQSLSLKINELTTNYKTQKLNLISQLKISDEKLTLSQAAIQRLSTQCETYAKSKGKYKTACLILAAVAAGLIVEKIID